MSVRHLSNNPSLRALRAREWANSMKFKASEIPFAKGQAEIDLKRWAELSAFVDENDNLKGYIFRGHSRSSFNLSPTLIRAINDKYSVPPSNVASIINQQLKRFRLALRGRIPLSDREAASESEIWAVGQHHGLVTPLLDWTASPLVAAFFAFNESRSLVLAEGSDEKSVLDQLELFKKSSQEPRAVFAFFARRINEVFYEWVTTKELESLDSGLPDKLTKMASFMEGDDHGAGLGMIERIAERLFPADPDTFCKCKEAVDAAELVVPRVISPLSGENSRLISQRGLFTKHYSPLEDMVAKLFVDDQAGAKYFSHEPILLKINIPNSERDRALRWLDSANINFLSLFPDLQGASLFANTRL
jgi:FRG domain-containing protein